MDKVELGSKTAKDGFKNEDFVVFTFNNWENNVLARKWLIAMDYKISEIKEVRAQKIKGSYKADIQVVVLIQIKLRNLQDVQNIQVKLVSNMQGFNQIDKRWIKSYKELWNIPYDICDILQRFTGEITPNIDNPRDKRIMFLEENLLVNVF